MHWGGFLLGRDSLCFLRIIKNYKEFSSLGENPELELRKKNQIILLRYK
jgi:hypothetical protein